MTLQEVKNLMREEDQLLLDTLVALYRDMMFGANDGIYEIVIYYLQEIQNKYGNELITKFMDTEEFKSLKQGA